VQHPRLVTIPAGVGGNMGAILVRAGDRVAEGQVLATIVNLTFVPVLYVVIVGLRERFSGGQAPPIEDLGPPTIERSTRGGLVVSFPNGTHPVRMHVPAVEEAEPTETP